MKHPHYISIFIHLLDKQAWERATTYIRQPELVRGRVEEIIAQNKPADTIEDVKASLANLNRKINNLIRLAEDVTDDNELFNMKGRMVELQKQKPELTILLNEVVEEQDLHEEMQTACVILGITATVYPEKPEYPTRIQLEVAPPSIMKIVSKTCGNISNCSS